MPTALRNGQWVLAYPGIDIAMGWGTRYPFTAPPDLGSLTPRTQDADRPMGDGVVFGVDSRPGRTIAFEMGVDTYGEREGYDAHAELETAWRGDRFRRESGAVAELHTMNGGAHRVCYGRPRRWASVLAQVPASGWSQATADFACVDDLFYAAEEDAITVPIVAPTQPGFTFPVVFPIQLAAPTSKNGVIAPGGMVETWPIITFYGPVTNPSCSLTGVWTLALTTSIPERDSVTIDARPWKRSVLRRDGASLAGALTPKSTPLAKATITPGAHTEVQFGGTSDTGTASMRLAWHKAYPHP